MDSLATAREMSVSRVEAAQRLGVPEYVVDSLIDAELLAECGHADMQVIYGPRAHIERASVDTLIDRVAEVPTTMGGDFVELQLALRRSGLARSWAAVLRLILDRRISIGPRDPLAELKISSLLLSEKDLTATQPGSDQPAAPRMVSCQVAAQILGTTQQFIASAVRAGVLKGRVGTRTSEILLDEVKAFAERYVLNAEACRRLDCGRGAVRHRLRSEGLEPAKTIGRTNLWLRADIAELSSALD